jgi:hypothetical protein
LSRAHHISFIPINLHVVLSSRPERGAPRKRARNGKSCFFTCLEISNLSYSPQIFLELLYHSIHQLLPLDSKCNDPFGQTPGVRVCNTCYDGGVWSLPPHDNDRLCLRHRIAVLLLLPATLVVVVRRRDVHKTALHGDETRGPASARGGSTRIRAPPR